MSDDMSTVVQSLVKLASALRYLFHAIRWKLGGICFLDFRKNGFACYPELCCLCLCMSLMLLAFRRHYPVLSGLMPSYLIVRRQGFSSHILVTHDPLLDLSQVR
jgi:hypothetical protein